MRKNKIKFGVILLSFLYFFLILNSTIQYNVTSFGSLGNEQENNLNTYAKRGIFLQGVLTRFLLAVQYTNLGSTPFESKLYGLQLDHRKLVKLLPQIHAKLIEYGAGFYHGLEKLLASYHVAISDSDWGQLTADEISYYFTLGLTLGQSFKADKED